MAEDEDEPEESTFEEIMKAIEKERSKRREEVSYHWVNIIREAGELYRDTEDVKAVSDELEIRDREAHEAITVYRLIFEDPPEEVAAKSSTAGRYYFSIEEDDEKGVAEDEEESIEDLVREYVGALYLQRDIIDEPVGDPPERTMPPMAFDMADLAEELGDDFAPTMNAVLEVSIPGTTDILGSHEWLVEGAIPSIVAQQGLLDEDIICSIITQQREIMQSAISAGLPSIFESIQHQQDLMDVSIVNSIGGIQFPESVVADLASIQPSVSTTPTAEPAPATPDTEDSATAGAPTIRVEADSPEITTTVTGTGGVTLDATLPDSDAFTTELVFEIPAMIVETILSTGQARTWFTNLSKDLGFAR